MTEREPLRWSERALVAFLRRVLAVFFRRIEVAGVERVPRQGPLVVVANHVNGLVDPMLVVAALPRLPRFLAKNTLWRIAPLRPFLSWARAIPVHRPGDPGADPAQNAATFTAAAEVLAAGGVVALFPEGRSHSEPGLAPLKTGAARIALAGEALAPGLGVAVLPVGLVFDAKHRFRSRVLVEIGEPFPALEGRSPRTAPQTTDPQAVRELTERIDAALDAVTVGYGTWDEARLVARAAEIYARPSLDVPRTPRLAALAGAQRAFAAGYRRLAAEHPARLAEVAEAVRRYDRLLHAAGLTDAQVASEYPLPRIALFLRRTLGTLAVRLPLAALGTVLNLVPFQAVSLVARRVEGADQKATWKVVAALVLYPLTWIAEAGAAGWLAARILAPAPAISAALLVLALGPTSGLLALRFHDRRSRLAAEARAYLLLRTRRRFAAQLRAERRAVHAGVAELVELHERSGDGESR